MLIVHGKHKENEVKIQGTEEIIFVVEALQKKEIYKYLGKKQDIKTEAKEKNPDWKNITRIKFKLYEAQTEQ